VGWGGGVEILGEEEVEKRSVGGGKREVIAVGIRGGEWMFRREEDGLDFFSVSAKYRVEACVECGLRLSKGG
jgi:hypothetical protein